MTTTPSHDDEGELLVKSSRLRFGGDVVVPERTEKLENDEESEEIMGNMLGQSCMAITMARLVFRSEGPMALETAMAWSFKRRGFTPSCRSCEPDTRPAAELRPSNAPLKVLRGHPIPILHGSWS